MVMELQDPDGGNDADEEQKNGWRIPGEHPTQRLARLQGGNKGR